ncbi:hypothetical protein [Mycobacteroides abscessus]|uniref:hypothetical protein n=1 Tax=Mycobacteroides abscessus TaxID=36809 RepID=UPI001C6B6A80|nr:hypothetical protein [Mycobacteroides abscessus]
MTTPGGVPNLPVGALTVETLAEKLQDLTPATMRNRAAERMPGTFHSSTGGDPLQDLTPFGILTKLFAGFNSHVANADPNDIQGPEDLPGLLLDFIESLPVVGQFVGLAEAIMGTYDGDDETLLAIQQIFMPIRRLLQLASGQDVGWPTLEEIEEGWGNLFAAIAKAVSQFFKGVIPAAWVADVQKDLTDGAGGFTDPSVVDDNPDWHYDAAQNGHLSGKSIYVNADGHLYVISVKDPFEVAPGQTVDMGASAMWQGLAATAGSNPIRLCITPFGPDGTKLPDIVIKQIQPVAADSAWVRASLTGSWTVPADGSIKWATVTLVVTEGASGGPVHFSNVASVMSNLGPVLGKFRSFFDAIGGQANSGIVQFEQRFAAITADGKITASEIEGLIQQAQVSGLAIIQTIINQILDILNGNLVTPINSLVQGVKDWFGLNQNKTQALNSSGQMSGSAITGAINEAATGLGALRDAIGAGLGFLGGSMTNQDAQNQAILVAQTAAQAAAAAAAANAQLAKSQGQSNTGAGGLSYATTFGGADGAVLPAEFSSSDLGIRGSNGYVGIDASRPDGTYLATCSKMCNSDDQSIAVVLGDQGGSIAAPMYVLFHSDSADTAGAAVRIDYSSVILGSYTRSGSTYSFTPFSGGVWSGSLGQGMLVEAHNVGTSWTISVGGNAVLSVTNSSVTFGPTRRYSGGIVMARATVNLGWFQGTKTYDSFRLAAMTLGDYVIPAYAGSGARIARTSTAVVSCASLSTAGTGSSAHGLIATDYFNVIRESTPDIAVDLSNGKFTVSEPDWYRVTLRYLWAETSNGINDRVALFKNGSIYAFGNPTFSFDNDGTTTTKWSIGGATSWDVYLAAGDNVQAAHSAFQIAGTGTFASVTKYGGDSSGLEAFMTIARK